MTGNRAASFALAAVVAFASSSPGATQTVERRQDYPDCWWAMYDIYLEPAGEVPGYGGHYYDENMNIVVYLQDPATQERAAQTALMAEARRKLGGPTDMRSVKGKYTVVDLIRWHDAVRQNLYRKFNIVSNGLDIRNHRVVIGVKPGTDQEALLDALEDQGVPRVAVDIGESEDLVTDERTPRTRITPTTGGTCIAATCSRPKPSPHTPAWPPKTA